MEKRQQKFTAFWQEKKVQNFLLHAKNLAEFRIDVLNFIQYIDILLVNVILNVSGETVLQVTHPIGKYLARLLFDAHAFTTM